MTVFYVICFDVHDAKRLRKISNEMENFGVRVQRSVFECHLETAQLQELQRRLGDLMEPTEDQVRYYSYAVKINSISSSMVQDGLAPTRIIICSKARNAILRRVDAKSDVF